jgi:periplasmic protein TonB
MTRPQAAALPLSFVAHGCALAALTALAVMPRDLPTARAASPLPVDVAVLRVASPPGSAPVRRVPPRRPSRATENRLSVTVPPPPVVTIDPRPHDLIDDLTIDTLPSGPPGTGAGCVGCTIGRELVAGPEGNSPGEGGGAPVRVGGQIREPHKLRHVAPAYPDIARRARVQGVVVVECTLTPEGRVAGARVLSGHPLLSPAAVDAVEQWLFTPTLLNGVAVPVILTVTVNFQLS